MKICEGRRFSVVRLAVHDSCLRSYSDYIPGSYFNQRKANFSNKTKFQKSRKQKLKCITKLCILSKITSATHKSINIFFRKFRFCLISVFNFQYSSEISIRHQYTHIWCFLSLFGEHWQFMNIETKRLIILTNNIMDAVFITLRHKYVSKSIFPTMLCSFCSPETQQFQKNNNFSFFNQKISKSKRRSFIGIINET